MSTAQKPTVEQREQTSALFTKKAKRGQTAAIVPSETKPARQKPMTDEEFEVAPVSTGPTERQIAYVRSILMREAGQLDLFGGGQ